MNFKTYSISALFFGLTLCSGISQSTSAQTNPKTEKSVKITNQILNDIVNKNRDFAKDGKVADYIPELGKANPNAIGIALVDEKGKLYAAGDTTQKFTIQSISKIVALMIAIQENGEKAVFDRIGYYGTNQPFNHFANLDNGGKALNPMMNAGAITTTAMINGDGDVAYQKIIAMIRYITKNPSIEINESVFLSEKETGHRNRGMFHILKNSGLVEGTEDKLDNYFKQCSIEITVEDLAKIGYFFANDCTRFDGDQTYKNDELAKIIQSQMLIAGMYDFSGEYARTVGLPSKSGVGGGITVSVPNKMGIGVYSPSLDTHGNSLAGYHMLLDVVKQFKLGIF